MTIDALEIDPARTALLVMDFQRDIASAGGKAAPTDDDALRRFDAAIAAAATVLTAARQAEMLVVHVAVARAPGAASETVHVPLFRFLAEIDALAEGTPGVEFVEALRPRRDEIVVTKRGISAFVGTELRARLEDRGIETVVLTGLVTHWVVEGTARDAADHGERVIVLSDCCASGRPSAHDEALGRLRQLGSVVDAAWFVDAIVS